MPVGLANVNAAACAVILTNLLVCTGVTVAALATDWTEPPTFVIVPSSALYLNAPPSTYNWPAFAIVVAGIVPLWRVIVLVAFASKWVPDVKVLFVLNTKLLFWLTKNERVVLFM